MSFSLTKPLALKQRHLAKCFLFITMTRPRCVSTHVIPAYELFNVMIGKNSQKAKRVSKIENSKAGLWQILTKLFLSNCLAII